MLNDARRTRKHPRNGGSIIIAEKQLFRACAQQEHHHHLVCEKCGKAAEVEPPSEDWISTTAAAHGFEVGRHEFEIFGLCSDCSTAAKNG